LTEEEIADLPYKRHPFAEMVGAASPRGLIARAEGVRACRRELDREALAAHLELAAETIDALLRYLLR
jgi:hypothetical protein